MVQRGQADQVKIAEGHVLSTGLFKCFGKRTLKFRETRDGDLTAMEEGDNGDMTVYDRCEHRCLHRKRTD